jgi:tripartite-type tricarboxylate transporter receptor subunit TctC
LRPERQEEIRIGDVATVSVAHARAAAASEGSIEPHAREAYARSRTASAKSRSLPWEAAMTLPRRRFLHLATATAALPAIARAAWAQSYPARPVRLIVQVPAGSAPDIIARLMADWLSARLGQQFVIDNRPGASGNIATEAVIRAPADGYTLLLAMSANAINASLYSNLRFSFARDAAPVASIGRIPLALEINPSVPARTVPEFIAHAKANPGKINVASTGNGTPLHVAAELFNMMAGVKLVHVAYRGEPVALPDLVSGQVQVMFGVLPSTLPYIRSGQIRALAVTTTKRQDVLPGVPAMDEFLPGYEASGWYGIAAPKDTPGEIVDGLNKEINAGLADPKTRQRLTDLGCLLFAGSPADFGKFIAGETEKWTKVVRAAGLKAQ